VGGWDGKGTIPSMRKNERKSDLIRLKETTQGKGTVNHSCVLNHKQRRKEGKSEAGRNERTNQPLRNERRRVLRVRRTQKDKRDKHSKKKESRGGRRGQGRRGGETKDLFPQITRERRLY